MDASFQPGLRQQLQQLHLALNAHPSTLLLVPDDLDDVERAGYGAMPRAWVIEGQRGEIRATEAGLELMGLVARVVNASGLATEDGPLLRIVEDRVFFARMPDQREAKNICFHLAIPVVGGDGLMIPLP
jgi:hypothetical protein